MEGKTVHKEDNEEEEPGIQYPYPVEDADHCETPEAAYRDIAGVLEFLALRMGKDRSNLSIYDPFFCEGSIVSRLGALGFQNVYNRCEDFYAVQAEGKGPDYDGREKTAD